MKKDSILHRCSCPNNNLFIIALLLLITFLLVELTLRIYDLYFYIPSVDVPSHFFAGIAIGAASLWVTSLTQIKHKKWLSMLAVFLSAIIWEILETLQEMVISNPIYLRDIFLWDGFWDIVTTLIGGVFIIILLWTFRNSKRLRDTNIN